MYHLVHYNSAFIRKKQQQRELMKKRLKGIRQKLHILKDNKLDVAELKDEDFQEIPNNMEMDVRNIETWAN